MVVISGSKEKMEIWSGNGMETTVFFVNGMCFLIVSKEKLVLSESVETL